MAGADGVRDAVAEALVYAWEHWDRVMVMDNPAGYLYRWQGVGSQERSGRPTGPRAGPAARGGAPPARGLGPAERASALAVFLVAGCDWSYGEVATLMGISVSSVRNHLSRGLERLRTIMEVEARA